MVDDHVELETGRNRRLGEFLRARRARTAPDLADAKLTRRRTAGLRREDVAAAAGISTEWYVKLEQGRGTSPSLATLDGIAEALRLDEAERLHLLALAGRSTPIMPPPTPIPAALRDIVKGMDQPAYVTDPCWDVLVWNRAATDLLQVDFAAMADGDRNILLWMLTHSGARDLFGESWEDEARRMTSLFRTTCDLFSGDPALARRVTRLKAESDCFATWWARHDIGAPRSGEKRLHHPVHGCVSVRFSTFQCNDDPRLKLALYSQPTRRPSR